MKKNAIYSLIIGLSCLVTACNADKVGEVDFDVHLRNSPSGIHAGDEVVFDFSGDPDYIVFWSGEDGHRYEYRNRSNVDVEALTLTYSVMHRYGRAHTSDVLSILLSENFSADYTKEGIEAADWTVLSQSEDDTKEWWVPSSTQSTAKQSGGDISMYKDRRFTIAFRYKLPAPLTEHEQFPRIDIDPISLNKTTEGKVVSEKDPKSDLGFRFVRIDGPETKTSVDETGILFQPDNSTKPLNAEYWCISKQIDPSRIPADKGEPVRSLTVPSDSYTHVFEDAGTYRVTFVGRNANAWNCSEAVREIVMEVLD